MPPHPQHALRYWCPDHPDGYLFALTVLAWFMRLTFLSWERRGPGGCWLQFGKCVCSPRPFAYVRSPWTFSGYTQACKESEDWPTGDAKLCKSLYLSVYPDSRGISFEGTPCSLNLVPYCYREQSQCEILFINTSSSNIKLSLLPSFPPFFPNICRDKLFHNLTSLLISHLSLFQDNLHPILKCAQITFYLKSFFSIPGIFY